LGGLYGPRPWLALLFLIPALSLAGIPPLSGFFAKLALIRAGLQSEQYGIVVAALAVSLLTLFSMIKIWTEVFWKEEPAQGSDAGEIALAPPGVSILLLSPIVIMSVLIIGIGLGGEMVFTLAFEAARQLMQPQRYIQAVRGVQP
jgi:multicomponent Na+:H+ antiporter subunit D